VKLSTEVVLELQGFIESAKGKNLPWSDSRIFQTRIRRNIKLAESPSFGQTILAYGPTSNGAADYRALAKEVESMTAATSVTTPAATPRDQTPPQPKVSVTITPPVQNPEVAA